MGMWETFDGTKIDGPFEERLLLDAIAKGLDAGVVVRKVGDEDWKPLSAFSAASANCGKARAKASDERAPAPFWRRPLGPLGVAVVILALLVVNTLWVGAGANVEANCTTLPDGQLTCEFTNRGILPGRACAAMVIRRVGEGASQGMRSAPICSGTMWPSSSTREGRIFGFEMAPGPYCITGKDAADMAGHTWSDFCLVSVEPAR